MNGKLTVKSDSPRFFGTTVLIDGKKFPVTDMKISGNIKDNIWKIEASFWVKSLDIDLIADIYLEKKESEK